MQQKISSKPEEKSTYPFQKRTFLQLKFITWEMQASDVYLLRGEQLEKSPICSSSSSTHCAKKQLSTR